MVFPSFIDLALQVNRQLPGLPPQNAGVSQNRSWVYSLGSLFLLIHIWILLLTSMSTTLAGPPLPLTDRMPPMSYLLISALCLCRGPFSVSSVFYVVVFYAWVLCFHHFHSPLLLSITPHSPQIHIIHICVYMCAPNHLNPFRVILGVFRDCPFEIG